MKSKFYALLISASQKSQFPTIYGIVRRTPVVFFITFAAFFVARPTAIFNQIIPQNQWKFYVGYPVLAVLVQVVSWFLLGEIIPHYYKTKHWTKGISLSVKFIIAFFILTSFHFYTLFWGVKSSLEFFLALGLPLALFPALYYLGVESRAVVGVATTPRSIRMNTSDVNLFLFAETHTAHLKRWGKNELRRNEIYVYCEKGDQKQQPQDWQMNREHATIESFLAQHAILNYLLCHKSYCVNVNQIKAGIGNSKKFSVIVGTKNYEIPVSREEYEPLKAALQASNVPIFSTLPAYSQPIVSVWQEITH